MTRRWSLAAAFLLTVVCGFLIVSFGSSSGVFAWAGGGGSGTGAVQTQTSQPATDVTITDASIPVDYGTAASNASDTPQGDDDESEHREGDDREDGEHEEGERD